MSQPPDPPVHCCQCRSGVYRSAKEPDGLLRCYGHSLDPAVIARRQAHAERGRAEGERQRGVPKADRSQVLAGVVDIDTVRARAHDARHTKKEKDAVDEAKPIALRTREDVTGLLERSAGRLFAGADAKEAQAVSALARTALAALGFVVPEQAEDEEETGAIEFRVLPKRQTSA